MDHYGCNETSAHLWLFTPCFAYIFVPVGFQGFLGKGVPPTILSGQPGIQLFVYGANHSSSLIHHHKHPFFLMK